MKKGLLFLLSFVLLAVTSCGDDDKGATGTTAVSFANQSVNLTEAATPIQIVFSTAAPASGSITIAYTTTGAAYGTDFTTIPAATSNTLTVPFNAGDSGVSFSFNKLIDAGDDEVKSVTFTITATTIDASITGIVATVVNFNEAPLLGGTQVKPETGGPNQPNQVYIDLSSGAMATVPRVSWDLGFYAGDDYRIVLNSSLKMTAKALNTTNIDEVVAPANDMNFGQGSGSTDLVDHPSGDLTRTVLAEVSENDEDNKVYLIKLGNGPANNTPQAGTEGSAAGPDRGWRKVRILRSGNDYKFQYANIDATTHQEVTITKNAAYNFVFFSFTTNTLAQVEPQKNMWDINFTTFTNFTAAGTEEIPYYFPDFIVTNVKGGAKSYMVLTADKEYNAFSLADVDQTKFTAGVAENEDQRNIGSNWRSTSVPGPGGIPVSQFVVKTDRYFILKDPAGNIYKLQMTGGLNTGGERGFPEFKYELLQ